MDEFLKAQKKANVYAHHAREDQFRDHLTRRRNFSALRDQNDFQSMGSESFKSLPRLQFYVSLQEVDLGPFVNVARQKAITAYLAGYRQWSTHLRIDVADIGITIHGRKCFIKIMPVDSFYCEFATTGWPLVIDPAYPSTPVSKGMVIGVDVSVKNGATKVVSHVNTGKRSKDFGRTESRYGRVNQVQYVCEPSMNPQGVLTFKRWHYPVNLFQAWAPGNPYTGTPLRNSLRGTDTTLGEVPYVQPNPGPLQQYIERDIRFDIPFAKSVQDEKVQFAYVRGAADWPRANGLQLKDSAWGQREFAIYVDAFNQFSIFPTAAIEALDDIDPTLQNVDELYLTRLAPTIPAWARVPSEKWSTYYGTPPDHDLLPHALVDGPELHWHFNHLGTKAATIALERSAYAYDSAYWGSSATGTPFTLTKFNQVRDTMGVHSRNNINFDTGYSEQRYFTAPGILEATVAITVTGPQLQDYTATVTIAERSRPNADGPCPMLCGYVWYDIYKPGGKVKLASAGDFMSLDLEAWNSGDKTRGEFDHASLLALRNVDTNAEILTWPGMPVMGADFTTLSFVFKVQDLEHRADAAYPGRPGHASPQNITLYQYAFGAAIYSQGEFKEILFPETLPADKIATLEAILTQTGREYIADLVSQNANWELVPLYQPLDGWGLDTDIDNLRKYYAHLWGYRTPTQAFDAPTSAANDKLFAKWRPMVGEPSHLLYCDNPRWGWHCYESAIASHMHLFAYDTYWTHPNGTYCFFSNQYIYNPNGCPNSFIDSDHPSVTTFFADSLSQFDASLLEHVVFDRVHFELRVDNKPIGHLDTTFVKLYNAAVKAGLAANKLEAGIEQMQPENLRARFDYGEYDVGGGWKILNLKATWDDSASWFYETAVQGGSYAVSISDTDLGLQGQLVGFGFASTWVDADELAGVVVAPYSADRHVRFTGFMIAEPKQ